MEQYNQQQNIPSNQMPPPPNGAQQGQAPDTNSETVSNEELIEAIIDEKWNELVKDINKIIEWKNNAEKRLTTMEEKISAMKGDFDKLHNSVIGKIGEYDGHIQNVGSEIEAMEKVFAKVLPVFTQKVDELSRVADDFKEMSSSQKK